MSRYECMACCSLPTHEVQFQGKGPLYPYCSGHANAFATTRGDIVRELAPGSPPTLPSAPAAPVVAHPEPPPVESVPPPARPCGMYCSPDDGEHTRECVYGPAPADVFRATMQDLAAKHAPAVKATNPKDFAAGTRLPMHLVPKTMVAYASLSFHEGALKYGAYNWREAGVMASVYQSAIERHMAKFWNGEWADPKTHVPHLASVLASVAILLDASLLDKVIDDRPPRIALTEEFDALEPIVAHLKGLFGATPKAPVTHKAHPLTEGSLEDDTDR